MEGVYDENLTENPFYKEFKSKYSNLFDHCISEAWTICVPRIGCLSSRTFTVEDVCAHVLVPNEELPQTHYHTLTEKQVTVVNKVVTIEVAKGLPLQSHILFEETFYTDDNMKYKIWCIEKPLGLSTDQTDSAVMSEHLTTINDCINLLWTQSAGRQVLDQIECCTQEFLSKHSSLPIALAPLKDAICALYTQCLQVALQNRRLRELSKTCKHSLENIKLAVECYMQHLIFNSLFKTLCTCCSYEDSHLNKRIRNLSDLQLRDLDVRKDLYSNIPKAKQLLSKLNSYSTVLEKVMCLKKSLNAIVKTDSSNQKVLLAADDMIPVLVFLVLKSNLPNWFSQLTFMKEFRFSGIAKRDGDECGFLITTLEAVIQHIQSDALTGSQHTEADYYGNYVSEDHFENIRRASLTESISTNGTNTNEETLEYIFELIKSSHSEQVRAILEKNKKHLELIELEENRIKSENGLFTDEENDSDLDMNLKLCHPLCSCHRCCRRISKKLLKTCPTVSSRDSHGLTPLHFASIHGKAIIVELLLDLGAETDATDLNECTPLHHAATRGHQNALLLLLHSGAKINSINIDKNSALHLAVNNGHINCVKALIYFSEHGRKNLKINCTNDAGNTPLHIASKWGYEGIAKLLIKHGAEPSLRNRYKKTAFDYAHNLRIVKILKSCSPSLYEFIHITNSDSNILNVRCHEEFVDLNTSSESHDDNDNACDTVENLKRIDRISQAIKFKDVKLACFYLNINYLDYVNQKPENGYSCHPLCECNKCKKNSASCASSYDVNLCDSNGFNALHYTAQFGLEELCNILILNNADINSRNKKGQTPLHLAACANKPQIIKLLVENGANINAIDSSGNTALHEASTCGNIGAAKTLLSHHPDTSITNSAGYTALDIAKEKVHLTIIDLIEHLE